MKSLACLSAELAGGNTCRGDDFPEFSSSLKQ